MPQVRIAFLAGNRRPLHANRLSRISRTFSCAIGAQKLGQPVPESNFVAELNSALSQQMQRKIPLSCRFQYFPVYAISVSACRVISNAPGESCFRHSSSVFTTFAIFTFPSRLPSSENCTIVTSPGSDFAALQSRAASATATTARPPSAAPAPAQKHPPRKRSHPYTAIPDQT